MFRAKLDNVERVVDSQHALDTLLRQGYTLVEEEQQPIKEDDINLNELTVDQLKDMARDSEIEFPSKIKKEELINLLEGVE